MEAVPQEINISANILALPSCTLQGLKKCDHKRIGPLTEGITDTSVHSLYVQPYVEDIEDDEDVWVPEEYELRSADPLTRLSGFTNLGVRIPRKYAHVFEGPKGLPPRRPHLGTRALGFIYCLEQAHHTAHHTL